MNHRQVLLKINRTVVAISKLDHICDFGTHVLVTSICDSTGHTLQMSKKMFREFKSLGFIFVDEETTKRINSHLRSMGEPNVTFYSFDVDRLLELGYEEYNEIEEG